MTTWKRWDSYADRLLGLTESADGDGVAVRYVTTVRAGFLFLVFAQMVHFVFRDDYYIDLEQGPLWATRSQGTLVGLSMVFAVFACAACALTRFRRLGLAALVLLWAFHIFWRFPYVANHSFLMFFVLSALAFCGRDSAQEHSLAFAGLRWLAIVVLLWSGVQKVLYGQFFEGEFLAYRIAVDERHSTVFAWFMADEVARLLALPSDGPFAFQNPLGLVLSNLTYLAEIALGSTLLLSARLRPVAWAFAALLVGVIEASAREFYFGLAMLQLLVLFAPERHQRLWAPVFAAAPVLLLLASLGIIPSFGIT